MSYGSRDMQCESRSYTKSSAKRSSGMMLKSSASKKQSSGTSMFSGLAGLFSGFGGGSAAKPEKAKKATPPKKSENIKASLKSSMQQELGMDAMDC
jgi:hypothetical protein